jgi:hypothetical protein
MKTSWLMGVVIIYMGLWVYEMMLTGGTSLTNIITTNAGVLLQHQVVSSSNIALQALTGLMNIGAYIVAVIQVIFLWCPTVWTGYMLWFYWFICFPIACATVYAIVTLIRGGGSA